MLSRFKSAVRQVTLSGFAASCKSDYNSERTSVFKTFLFFIPFDRLARGCPDTEAVSPRFRASLPHPSRRFIFNLNTDYFSRAHFISLSLKPSDNAVPANLRIFFLQSASEAIARGTSEIVNREHWGLIAFLSTRPPQIFLNLH